MGLRQRFLVLPAAAGLLIAAAGWLWSTRGDRAPGGSLPAGDYEPHPRPGWVTAAADAAALREDALARARVWRPPAESIDRVDLTRNPGDSDPLDTSEVLHCRFLPEAPSGTTPKFDCVLKGGEIVKVKYGGSRELPSEVAAARLLAALGFGADRMYVVPRLRCFGCPAAPFHTYRILDLARAREIYERWTRNERPRDFEWVAVERRFPGATIAAADSKGWSFAELHTIDAARGGASRAEVDALRLVAVFLHHWDNKPANQRLVCLATPRAAGNGACPEPFALLQDVGSSFGPRKVDLARWSGRPFWKDAASCTVDMEDLPYGGATFRPVQVTEAGRRFLADQLTRLSDTQVRGLFEGARFGELHPPGRPGRDVGQWVRAFREKVQALADRPPCPPLLIPGGAPSPRPRWPPSA